MKTALLLRADGTQEPVMPANGKDFKLAELQKLVFGYVEVVNMPGELILVVNDDGKGRLPVNQQASNVWYHAYEGQDVDFAGDYIAGDAVLMHTSMMK